MDAHYGLALSCRMIRQASARTDACCHRVKLASSQRVEEITREYYALALPVGEAVSNQVLDASVHRLTDLAAESARAQGGRFTSDKLAVEPGGAASLDLRVDGQVGTHRQGDAPAANGILELAELDDAARRGIACSVEVGQTDMVSTSIDSVDNGVGGALELVIEPARDKPSDKLRGRVSAIERKVGDVPLDALIGKPAVDALDDVGPLAHRPHDGLGVLRQTPLRRSEGFGEAKALELFHAADHGGASVRLRSSVDAGSKINNPIIPRSLTGKRAIELGPAVRLDLSVEIAADLEVAARPELKGGKICGAGAQALADIIPGHHQVMAVVTLAAYDDMDVGIIGVPVLDPEPIELRGKIPLGLRHQVAGERLQIGEPLRVLRGHDEPEMMAIPFAALGECAVVGVVVLSVEQAAGGAVLRHAPTNGPFRVPSCCAT